MRKSVLGGPYVVDNGAYIVQPKLGPEDAGPIMLGINQFKIGGTTVLNRIMAAKGMIQKLQLFIRGNAISGAPIINGT